jgi:hypothetical protein
MITYTNRCDDYVVEYDVIAGMSRVIQIDSRSVPILVANACIINYNGMSWRECLGIITRFVVSIDLNHAPFSATFNASRITQIVAYRTIPNVRNRDAAVRTVVAHIVLYHDAGRPVIAVPVGLDGDCRSLPFVTNIAANHVVFVFNGVVALFDIHAMP